MTDYINKIHHADCLDILRALPDGCIDLMLQDPPYGVTDNDWDIVPNFAEMWLEWERVVRPDGAFIFTAQQPFSSDLVISRRGFFKYEWIWQKTIAVGFFNAKRRPLQKHENVLVFYRQQPTYNPQFGDGVPYTRARNRKKTCDNYGGTSLMNEHSTVNDGRRYPISVLDISSHNLGSQHPTQKPVDLWRYLIRTYSNEGDVVFDGYSGSGTTAIACIEEKRNYICCETNAEYHERSLSRVSQKLATPVLF